MIDTADLSSKIGTSIMHDQWLDATSLAKYGAASGDPSAAPALGHWAFFHDVTADTKLGPDGHPMRGDFLPAIPELPRRMFASARMILHAPLTIGDAARMTLTIIGLKRKKGQTGDMVFADVERVLAQGDQVRVTEVQTIVYRAAGAPLALPDVSDARGEGEIWRPAPVNLFRFSAATFNGHRIHYDRPYATEVEGYPRLVVHGPLIAARLAQLAARRGALASFEFRALAPCFVDQPIRLVESAPGEVHAQRCDGVTSMTAKAEYR